MRQPNLNKRPIDGCSGKGAALFETGILIALAIAAMTSASTLGGRTSSLLEEASISVESGNTPGEPNGNEPPPPPPPPPM